MEKTAEITIVDVAPADDDTWFVLIDGTLLGIFGDRKTAVEIATSLAQNQRPSRLLTRSGKGEIEAITPFSIEGRCAGAPLDEVMSLPQNDTFELND